MDLDAYTKDPGFMTLINGLTVRQRIGLLYRFGEEMFGPKPVVKKQREDVRAKMYAVQQSLWKDPDPIAQAFCQHQFDVVKRRVDQ